MDFRFTLNSVIGEEIIPEPIGWSEIQLTRKRSEKYRGFFYEISGVEKLEFVKDGCEYLKTIYDTYGPEQDVQLYVDLRCSGDYERVFDGLVNLNSFEEGEFGVRANTESTGFEVDFLNRVKTKTDLLVNEDVYGNAIAALSNMPHAITLHSKVLREESAWSADIEFNENVTPNPPSDTIFIAIPFQADLSELQEAQTVAPGFVKKLADQSDLNPYFENKTGREINSVDIIYDIDIDLSIFSPYATSFSSTITFWRASGNFNNGTSTLIQGGIDSKNINIPASSVGNYNHTASGTITTGLAEPSKLWALIVLAGYDNDNSNPLASNFAYSSNGTTLKITADTTTPETESNTFLIYEVFERLIQKYTGFADRLRSFQYGRTDSQPRQYDENGCGSFRAVTSGWLIRQFPDRGIVVNFEDTFDSMNAIDCIGMGMEGENIRIEPLEYFFDASETIMQFANINELTRLHDEDLTYNAVVIGYEKFEIEELNTVDEFNTESEYSVDLRKVDNEYEVISPFIASGYTIEISRRRSYVDDTSKSFPFDNDNFVIELNKTDKSVAEKDEGMTVTDLISPETSYNIRLNPASNLLRHAKVLASGLQKILPAFARFITTKANELMSVTFASGSCPGTVPGTEVAMNGNIDFSDTIDDVTPLWLPERFEFEYPLAYEDYNDLFELNANSGKPNIYHAFEISEENTNFIKVFIEEINYRPSQGLATFKCLRANV